jgi:hypothetical protein
MRILFLLAMDWTYEVFVLMLLWPMLFICTIAICSWDTYTTNMLLIIHERQLEKKMTHTNNWKEVRNNATNEKGII